MFNPCHACGRSQIHDVLYINSHQTVFHYVSDELLDRCRSCTLARRAGRLSLLLYSPAQDGKHIKCFPLRAELATNLNSGPPGPGIRRACRGNVPFQIGTGLFWSVLSGETSRSSGDLLSSVAWKSAAFPFNAKEAASPSMKRPQILRIDDGKGLFRFGLSC